MKKTLRTLMAGVVVATVVASTLFCCCTGKMLRVAAASGKALQSCCSANSVDGIRAAAAPCSCSSLNNTPKDLVSAGVVAVPFVQKVPGSFIAFIAPEGCFQVAILKAADTSPPLLKSYSDPLYIQLHNLRL